MNESKTMKHLHAIREKSYERRKHMSVKEQIATIQTEAEPIRKRLLDKMKKKEMPAPER